MKATNNSNSVNLIGATLLTLLPVSAAMAEQAKPNFLLLMSDDLTYTDLGFQGNTQVKTPFLDKLSKEGMRFKYCYNSSPMCAPTRMSLYTGIHPVRNGAYPNHSRVYDNIKSMPHYLKDMGYDVALIGKKHYAPEKNFPFEYLKGVSHDDGKGLDLNTDDAAAFMKSHKDKPWCLVVTSNQPHTPWNRGNPSEYDPAKVALPPYMVDTKETREAMTKYYAEIAYMDSQMGRVLQGLKDSGQVENTLVIYLSEQGSNFPHCKWTCYDTGLRSAAVVRWPKMVESGAVSEAMIQYVDVLPTFIEAAGGDPGKYDLDGKSFLAVIKGQSDKHREAVCGLQTTNGIIAGGKAGYGIRTIRDSRYRLIWNLNWQNKFQNTVVKGFKPYHSWDTKGKTGDKFAQEQYDRYKTRPEFELYDMQNDPYEMKNLAADPELKDIQAKLKSELNKWMAQQGDNGIETEAVARTRMASAAEKD